MLKPLEFSDGDRRIGIYPSDEFHVRCFIDYSHALIGRQNVDLTIDRETFSQELAHARTFGFVHEEAQLRAMGLIRGVSYDNVVVLDRENILNGPPRFQDEFCRHKALDLIGDLALVSRPLKALVVAHKAGHALHTQLVTRLLADTSLWTETTEEAQPAATRCDGSTDSGQRLIRLTPSAIFPEVIFQPSAEPANFCGPVFAVIPSQAPDFSNTKKSTQRGIQSCF